MTYWQRAALTPFLMSCSLVPFTAASAQDADAAATGSAPNEDIIVTAARGNQLLRETPRSVTVIGEEAIGEKLETTVDIANVLARTVPGMGTNDNRITNLGQNNIRGRRAQYVVDGVVLNSAFLDQGGERQSIALEQVGQIEVIRGGTAVYGFGAAGGVVSIKTRNPLDQDSGVSSSFQLRAQPTDIGSSLSGRTSQQLRYVNDSFGIEVTGVYDRTGQAFDGEGDVIPSFVTNFETRTFSFGGKAGVRIGEDQQITAGFTYFDLKAVDTTTPVGGNAQTNTKAGARRLGLNVPNLAVYAVSGGRDLPPSFRKSAFGTLEYSHENVFGGSLSLLGYWYKGQNRNNPALQTIGGQPQIVTQIAIDEKLGARLTLDTPLGIFGDDDRLVWGLDYQNAKFRQPVDVAGALPETPPVDQDSIAGFAQLNLKPADILVLTGGVRYEAAKTKVPDYIVALGSRAGSTVTGGKLKFDQVIFNAGAVLTLSRAFNPYIGYSQGFGIPELLRGLRGTTATSVAAAVESRPQIVNNYEIGARGRIGPANYSVAWFQSRSNLGASLQITPGTELAFLQRAPETVHGFEATLDVAVSDAFDLGGTFALQKGKQKLATGDVALGGDRITPTKVTGYANYRLGDVTLSVDALYSGSRNKFPGSLLPFQGDVSSLFLVNASVSLPLVGGEFTVGVQNLLDKQYVSQFAEARNQNPTYVAEPGRTLLLTYRTDW
jgi:iron complex outermembrane receptor protein